jgi:hypothetical protein
VLLLSLLFELSWFWLFVVVTISAVVCVALSNRPPEASTTSGAPQRPKATKKTAGAAATANPTLRTRTREVLRGKVMQEFVDTERSYVDKLATLSTVFADPLVERAILTPEQARTVFSDLAIIEHTNRAVVLAVLETWRPGGPLTPGDVFAELSGSAEFLAAYKAFVNNFDSSAELIRKLRAGDRRFGAFLDAALQDPRCQGLPLESFLILPVQRLPRYLLLLRELIKHTPQTNPDHVKLGAALDKLGKVAAMVN